MHLKMGEGGSNHRNIYPIKQKFAYAKVNSFPTIAQPKTTLENNQVQWMEEEINQVQATSNEIILNRKKRQNFNTCKQLCINLIKGSVSGEKLTLKGYILYDSISTTFSKTAKQVEQKTYLVVNWYLELGR